MSSVGQDIAEARKNRGLTQKQLAEKSGVSLNTLFKIEQGRNVPTPKTLDKLSQTLGITLGGHQEVRPPLMTEGSLPLNGLSDTRFEDLILGLVRRLGRYPNPQRYGGPGDKNRDVISRNVESGFVLFQCKRWKSNSTAKLKDELDGIKKHYFDKTHVDGKPNEIIFCLSCTASPKSKDSVREHAKALELPLPEIWDLDNLSSLIAEDEYLMREFFKGTSHELLGKQDEILEKSGEIQLEIHDLKKVGLATQDMLAAQFDTLQGKDRILREVRGLLQREEVEEAKRKLHYLIEEMEKKSPNDPDLARAYNNLGVCYNRSLASAGDFAKAVAYFRKALEIDPEHRKAEINLVKALLNTGTKDSYEEAEKWLFDEIEIEKDKSAELQGLMIQTLLRANKFGDLKLFVFDHLKKLRQLAHDDESLGAGLVDSLLIFNESAEALTLSTELTSLFPQSSQIRYTHARALISVAQKEDVDHKKATPIPFLKDATRVATAAKELEEAIELAKSEGQSARLINSIRVDLVICLEWLGKKSDSLIKSIAVEELGEVQRQQLQVAIFHKNLNGRLFDEAYNTLVNWDFYDDLSYREKFYLAYKFLQNGAPQQAIRVLKELKADAIEAKDVNYWLNLSTAYALADEKNQAIATVEESKRLFKDDKKIFPQVLSQAMALAMRYGSKEETDRLVENMVELNKYKTVMKPIPAIDENDQLSKEALEIFKQQRDFYENGKNMYQEKKLTTYWLQRYFNRTYPKALTIGAASGDTSFTIDYHDCPRSPKQRQAFSQGETVVFDYNALINLSKNNQLGLLAVFNKKIIIHRDLLKQIQEDLLSEEDITLRRLWQFVKSNPDIVSLYDDEISSGILDVDGIEELFPTWLLNSMRIAERGGLTFITDDAQLSITLEHKGMSTANSFAIFEEAFEKKYIDEKQFALIKGNLAELYYKFIPFNGVDLFYIALDDLDKIDRKELPFLDFTTQNGVTFRVSMRVYHLLNEMTFPGSNIPSFYGVILNFLERFFKTGILFEDKLNMLKAVTRLTLGHYKALKLQEDGDIQLFKDFLKLLWLTSYRQASERDRGAFRELAEKCLSGDEVTDSLHLLEGVKILLKLDQ